MSNLRLNWTVSCDVFRAKAKPAPDPGDARRRSHERRHADALVNDQWGERRHYGSNPSGYLYARMVDRGACTHSQHTYMPLFLSYALCARSGHAPYTHTTPAPPRVPARELRYPPTRRTDPERCPATPGAVVSDLVLQHHAGAELADGDGSCLLEEARNHEEGHDDEASQHAQGVCLRLLTRKDLVPRGHASRSECSPNYSPTFACFDCLAAVCDRCAYIMPSRSPFVASRLACMRRKIRYNPKTGKYEA